MSFYHIRKGGDGLVSVVSDNRTDSLHYFVNLDSKEIIYYMGRQIGTKKIRTGSRAWARVVQTAAYIWDVEVGRQKWQT